MPEPVRYQIRSSRARPPGLAAGDPLRRDAYNAALQQFEELLDSAENVSAASKPLLLYYAVTQAGRAIAAAHDSEYPKKGGHGLKAPFVSDADITQTTLSPTDDREFQYVSALIGSPSLPADTPLAALWGAIPDLADTPLPDTVPPVPRAREVLWDAPSKYWEGHRSSLVLARLSLHQSERGTLDELRTLLDHYPSAKECRVSLNSDGSPNIDDSSYYGDRYALIQWDARGYRLEDRLARINEVTPRDQQAPFDWWMIPQLPGGRCPSRLMTWWALLYGLSILARYHPGTWLEALRVDKSALAVPIEDALETAYRAIPPLVLDALVLLSPSATGDGSGDSAQQT